MRLCPPISEIPDNFLPHSEPSWSFSLEANRRKFEVSEAADKYLRHMSRIIICVQGISQAGPTLLARPASQHSLFPASWLDPQRGVLKKFPICSWGICLCIFASHLPNGHPDVRPTPLPVVMPPEPGRPIRTAAESLVDFVQVCHPLCCFFSSHIIIVLTPI